MAFCSIKGLTLLEEARKNSLSGNLRRLGVDIEGKRKARKPTKQVLQHDKRAKTEETNMKQEDGRMEGRQEATSTDMQEASLHHALQDDMIYISLMDQNTYVVKVYELARLKDSRVVPHLKVSEDAYDVHFAKHDYELTISIDYCKHKRLMVNRDHDGSLKRQQEGAIKERIQQLQSDVRLGFCVFETEANNFERGGTKYVFRSGEGTSDIDKGLDSDELRTHRRANLYRYQTNESASQLDPLDYDDETIPVKQKAHLLEVSSRLLEHQERSLGHPLFETPFKRKGHIDQALYENHSYNMSTDEMYHKAMRYRFEVVRLWWKLFHHQQDAVIEQIKDFSLSKKGLDVGDANDTNKIIDALIQKEGPAMVLAITELGKTGMLQPGVVYPNLEQKILKLYSTPGSDVSMTSEKVEGEFNPNVLQNKHERSLVEPVQLYGSDTWPIVKIGRNRSWFNRIGEIREDGILKKNIEAFEIMKCIFDDDVGVDYDRIFATPTIEMQKEQERMFASVDATRQPDAAFRIKLQFWSVFSVLAGDMMDSMPFWANAYLCDDLVEGAQSEEERRNKINELEEKLRELEEKLLGRHTDNEPRDDQVKDIFEQDTVNIELEQAQIAEQITALKNTSASHVIWHPYASNMQNERDGDDQQSPMSLSWAQECLHRAVIGVHSADWSRLYYSVDKGPLKQPSRSYNGMLFSHMEGESDSADFFRQWYDEVYTGYGEDGVALPGHLVIMNNLVEGKKATLEQRTGSVQLQGHVARILSRKRNYGEGRLPLFPPYTYTLETPFKVEQSEGDDTKGNFMVSASGNILVKLTDTNIMPLRYSNPYRYGDAVQLRFFGNDGSTRTQEAKIVRQQKVNKLYELFGVNVATQQREKWIVVDVPFIGPPSVLSSATDLNWGKFDRKDPRNSYKDAPKEYEPMIETLGSLVVTKHDEDKYSDSPHSYMRWPNAEMTLKRDFLQERKDAEIKTNLGPIDTKREHGKIRSLAFKRAEWVPLGHQE